MEKLSTGKRINSAKDDAAGLALSERMTTQIRGFDQAIRNTNDGVSFLQTADSALSNINDSLQRMRELAVQGSSNLSSADRKALESEMTQLTEEINRIAGSTQFNGKNLLDGSSSEHIFQIGANQGDTLNIKNNTDARAATLGGHGLSSSGTLMGEVVAATDNGVSAVVAGDAFTITTDSGTSGAITYAANSSAKDIAAAINSSAGAVGVEAKAQNEAVLDNVSATGAFSVTLNGSTINATIEDTGDLSALVAAINGSADDTGVIAEFTDSSSKDSITLKTNDGRNIVLDTTGGAGGASVDVDGTTVATTGSAVKTGTVSLSSSEGQMITSNASNEIFASAGTNTSEFSSLVTLDLSSQEGFQNAINTIDGAISKINSSRAGVGAYMNRMDSIIDNLSVASENAQASRSRIMDADFAKLSSEMIAEQIRQQSSLSILSQSSSLTQSALSLLR